MVEGVGGRVIRGGDLAYERGHGEGVGVLAGGDELGDEESLDVEERGETHLEELDLMGDGEGELVVVLGGAVDGGGGTDGGEGIEDAADRADDVELDDTAPKHALGTEGRGGVETLEVWAKVSRRREKEERDARRRVVDLPGGVVRRGMGQGEEEEKTYQTLTGQGGGDGRPTFSSAGCVLP